jgi:hypothetical protein
MKTLKFFYNIFIDHCLNKEKDVTSATMGIKEWLAPQISEHCPKKRPGIIKVNKTIFIRPGLASIFKPREGIAQE